MGFNCLKARATSRRQFTTKFPEILGTQFIDLGRMKGWVDLEPPSGFKHGTPDWEASALTTRSFIYEWFIYEWN